MPENYLLDITGGKPDLYDDNEAKPDTALGYLRAAYRLAPKRPNPPELVVERVA